MGRERWDMYVYMCVCVKGMRTKNVRKWERIQPLKEGDQAREDTYLYSVVYAC